MKLAATDIEKLEAMLTRRENGVSLRHIMTEFGLPDQASVSHFFATLQRLGIAAHKPRKGLVMITHSESEAFQEFLAEKRRREANGGAP